MRKIPTKMAYSSGRRRVERRVPITTTREFDPDFLEANIDEFRAYEGVVFLVLSEPDGHPRENRRDFVLVVLSV